MVNENVSKRRGGSERRTTHPKRQERRRRADQRAVEHADRSVEDQLALIAERAGYSRREVSRLTGGSFTVAQEALKALRDG